ncbi:hypothetical protein EIB18_12925 [Caulobacter vibrioides]|uniref:Uncharacterized protein n=2 Tax=Caulobacter vibrioides TaxID=155892 RepID=Q9A5K6_CAUVC|nr:hypothetical protein [Caulobacter vibrioides]YP_002517896.1 hypothetical protein CCNA_02523 [Caulobacter vibrioides NA1000]AAK24412.1 conserved hypothetical protein [Caulobacter vibrioides CB15]ACL95988.1 hypothetical protein CCNA_02523 [Caulobacter vibrioides NA1000]ATC25431.1 hypothetical protein CA608_13290 [Caulobacter vibrioides]ATC29294.1 hypothetical protein CA607_13225 [Caulobacter vibrioides]AZH13523.1 hypothetical protein EIB18_12925 [Caulobacter vibrioides]
MTKKVLMGLVAVAITGMSVSPALADGRNYAPAPAQRSYPPVPPPPSYPPAPRPPSPPPGPPVDDCLCTRPVVFYGPTTGWGDIRVAAPGVRVFGEPVVVPSGRIDIQGPPVYVDAPPVRVAAPQIYLHRPEVHVRPSAVTVEAPQIHFSGCADGVRCEPAPPRR